MVLGTCHLKCEHRAFQINNVEINVDFIVYQWKSIVRGQWL